MNSEVELLRGLARKTEPVLLPRAAVESPFGYSYPEAREVLQTAPGREVWHLEHLADLGCLDRALADRIHLCPACSSFALNYREVCPECGSARVDVVEMLHHLKCGTIAPEATFQQGTRYVCPKCHGELRHVGIDYERPTASFLCSGCDALSSEPTVSCLCLACGEVTPVDHTVTRTIYSYRLSMAGAAAAQRGETEGGATQTGCVDPSLGVYTERFFEEELARETTRARCLGQPFSVIVARPRGVEAFLVRHGAEATHALLKETVRGLKESLRESDLVARYDKRGFAVLLAGTAPSDAGEVARRLLESVAPRGNGDGPMRLTLGVASFRGGVEDGRQLLEEAIEELNLARDEDEARVPRGA